MDKRVKLVPRDKTYFCKYQPVEPTFEYFFAQYPDSKLKIEDFEDYVPSEWSVIVDEYGELEQLADELGFDNYNMADNVKHYIKKCDAKIAAQNEIIMKLICKVCEKDFEYTPQQMYAQCLEDIECMAKSKKY